ncbi:MAG: UbiD family decarboxylase [Synergistaceae bacterium]|jgi:2,5-furandicarboxylate decarboxylase 1|nr:UbiD family decarboxylase [Synergistaceae bacterium]
MQPGIREFIKILDDAGELVTIEKPVDPRDVSALISSSDKAVLLKNVKEYDFPIIGGIVRDERKVAAALGCKPKDAAWKLLEASKNPIKTVTVKDAPLKEVIIGERDVDLTKIPQITQHVKDGGPYIGSGIQFARHAKWGPDAGMYRHMFRTVNTMGIDFNTPNDIRMFYSEAFDRGESLEVAVAIGTHPIEMLAATASLPTGAYEMEFAGALRGEPVEMIRCETIDVEVPANAEFVLECEVLPTGWTTDEGRYGEFHGISGDVKNNPVVKVKTITHRKDAVFHSLIMPWEVYGLCAPCHELYALNVLVAARFRPVAVRSPIGACAAFELLASLDNPKPGEGKTALLALLSTFHVKKAAVFDDDIDIFDDDQVRWAEALRLQADEDVVIVRNCQAKHVDPSVRASSLPKGQLPVTSKLGIDATIPAGIPRVAYERARYFNPNGVKLEDYA